MSEIYIAQLQPNESLLTPAVAREIKMKISQSKKTTECNKQVVVCQRCLDMSD